MRVLYSTRPYKVKCTITCGFYPYSITLEEIVYAESKDDVIDYMRENYSSFMIESITEGSF